MNNDVGALVAAIRERYGGEDMITARRSGEEEARTLLNEAAGRFTRDQVVELGRLFNRSSKDGQLRYDRFSPAFQGATIEKLVDRLDAFNEWTDRLWSRDDAAALEAFEELLRDRELLPGAGTSYPSMLLYLRDPERWAVWGNATDRGLRELAGYSGPRVGRPGGFVPYCEAAQQFRREFELLPQELDLVLAVAAQEHRRTDRREAEEPVPGRVWIFQASPEIYDLDRAVKALDEITWTTRQHRRLIRAGDRVYVWRSGSSAGIVAIGRVLSDPESLPPSAEEFDFYKQPDLFRDTEPRVRVSVDKVLEPPLSRETLRRHPALEGLSVIRARSGTNFRVSPEEDLVLQELLGQGRLEDSAIRYFILQQRDDRAYDWDQEGELYHFTPRASGSWKQLSQSPGARFVYYRPGSGGGGTAKSYFGAGRIVNVDEEVRDGNRHFLAQVADYLPFERPVPASEFDPRPNPQLSIVEITRTDFEELLSRGGTSTEPPIEVPDPSLEEIMEAVRAEGLELDDQTIRRYHLSLATRGFVVLAGLSGAGKTWLAEAYARAVGARALLVPVAPNWTTNEDLLGYLNPLDDQYHDTQFSVFLREAAREFERAESDGRVPRRYHLILDEMNLARVEYYFAKFLSAMELRARAQVAMVELAPGSQVRLTPNLYFTGTVNVDETTHGFADKVYDRAQLIELPVSRQQLSDHLEGRPYRDLLLAVWDEVHEVAPFAFRVLDEIDTYVRAAEGVSVPWEQALDEQLLQKVLPKINGTDLRLRSVLKGFIDVAEDRFPLSLEKAQRMLTAFNEHGFTSYF